MINQLELLSSYLKEMTTQNFDSVEELLEFAAKDDKLAGKIIINHFNDSLTLDHFKLIVPFARILNKDDYELVEKQISSILKDVGLIESSDISLAEGMHEVSLREKVKYEIVSYLVTICLSAMMLTNLKVTVPNWLSEANTFLSIFEKLTAREQLDYFEASVYAAIQYADNDQELTNPNNLNGINILDLVETIQDLQSLVDVCKLAVQVAIFDDSETLVPSEHYAPLLDEKETVRLLTLGSGEDVALPFLTAHGSFESIAKDFPDKIALEQGSESLTYGELNALAENMAQRLVTLGVRSQSLVGIISNRSFEFIISMFAVLKAGGAFIPMDHTLPLKRLETILDDSKCGFVLVHPVADQDRVRLARGNDRKVLVLEASVFAKPAGAQHELPCARPDHSCYIVYTSGSTGKPKGVVIRHESVSNFANVAVPTAYGMKDRRWASILSINFSAFLKDIMACLNQGSTCLLKEDDSFDVLKTADSLHCTPSLLRMLNPLEYTNIKQIVLGGELPSMDVFLKWQDHAVIYNSYGVSELTHTPSSKLWVKNSSFISIGKALPNFNYYILDSQLRLVPNGVTGQVAVGGVGVASGYLHQTELTSEKFVTDHFARNGSKMYLTGDLGRWRENDEIEIVGRMDDMVKINGFRIELEEINRNIQNVENSIVLKIDNELVAFVTPLSANPEEIIEDLTDRLPLYMIPSIVIPLDAFPLSSNGKVLH
jgi:amino acid adenylation domain-containing protein